MQQKKVIVVATGGTIAMKYDEASQGLIPACSGEDLAAAVPGIDKLAQLEFCQFSNIASPGMTPDDMWRLHLKCEEFLAREDVTGVVVTHGIILRTAVGVETLRPALPIDEGAIGDIVFLGDISLKPDLDTGNAVANATLAKFLAVAADIGPREIA